MPHTVLVVDDSSLLHRMYGMFLRSYRTHELDVHFAMNGREALTKLAQLTETRLILLDINMPVMSGLEFLEHRNRESVFRHIPVVIVSTEGSEADIERGLRSGAKAYLVKPFKPEELRAVLDRVFGAPVAVPALTPARPLTRLA